jgi:hypothetical protein
MCGGERAKLSLHLHITRVFLGHVNVKLDYARVKVRPPRPAAAKAMAD